MEYQPLTGSKKDEWISALENIIPRLDGMRESTNNPILGSSNGDVADIKDIVGNFLATLTNKNVTIG